MCLGYPGSIAVMSHLWTGFLTGGFNQVRYIFKNGQKKKLAADALITINPNPNPNPFPTRLPRLPRTRSDRPAFSNASAAAAAKRAPINDADEDDSSSSESEDDPEIAAYVSMLGGRRPQLGR